jgi:WD40 repeat protein
MVLRGHQGPIRALAFALDGRLVSGSEDNTARVWDLENPSAAPLVLRGHEGSILALAFAPDGRLVSASSDNTARVWDLKNPSAAPLVLRGHKNWISALAFAQDGRLVSGSYDSTARVWDLKADRLLMLAEQAAGRNLSPLEWEQFFGQEPYRRTFPALADGEDLVSAGPNQ